MTEHHQSDKGDRFNEAALWALEQPELQEVMYETYTTYDTVEDARRFAKSGEFDATLEILSDLGQPPERCPRVLDIGCGNGIASYALSREGYDVVAVDSSASDVCGTGAAMKLQGTDGAHFELHTDDIRNIDFDADFDMVYARQFFHHMPELSTVVTGLENLLAPEGVLCALREHVVWNEKQRKQLLENHPLHHITQDEGAFYRDEYRDAFSQGSLKLAVELHPYESPINAHPRSMSEVRNMIHQKIPLLPRFAFNVNVLDELLRLGASLYGRRYDQLYSFFAVNESI
jgi:2-polyprenyl-3-methyl-5-hydroxy-6-metoxy-1,4-benzoquinol methylase